MTVQWLSFEQHPELVVRYAREAEPFWPRHMEFIYHDPVCERSWPRLESEYGAYQFLVFDDAQDRFLAVGYTVPLFWNGVDADLPDGVPDVLERVFDDRSSRPAATALCALLAGIQPQARSLGLSRDVLRHMRQVAGRHGLGWLVAPVRPTRKASYPITPMDRYARWRRADGRPLDPWLRTHERLGARYAGVCARGNVFRGTVAEWERWTGLALPESGEYVVAGALAPLRIDRDRDEGVLTEPGVWMVHTVAPGG